MLSTMTQVGAAACLAMLIWVMYGYGLAFGPEGNAFISWGKWFLAGVTSDSTAATFSDEVISEYVFICFQMTFAAITVALVLGSTVERIKRSEEHTSELQSLMRISYAVFCLKKKNQTKREARVADDTAHENN